MRSNRQRALGKPIITNCSLAIRCAPVPCVISPLFLGSPMERGRLKRRRPRWWRRRRTSRKRSRPWRRSTFLSASSSSFRLLPEVTFYPSLSFFSSTETIPSCLTFRIFLDL
ncbi:unnamed protein product [Musa hybrid cultivar]